MSNIDKRALREAAERATPGPWGISRDGKTITSNQSHPVAVITEAFHRMLANGKDGSDVEFIAAANPETVLALLDELEDYKAAYEEESREKDVQRSVIDDALCNLLPGCQYMDLPDGGSVTPLEQVSRMIAEYREKLQVAEKRIAELEAREVRLPELCVGVVQGGHAVMVPYAAGHWFNKTAILEMLADAGINVVAASGKGEAS